MSKGASSIIENIFRVIGKIITVAVYTVSKACESILHGLNEYLNKKIQQP